jgi:hypothetical protein
VRCALLLDEEVLGSSGSDFYDRVGAARPGATPSEPASPGGQRGNDAKPSYGVSSSCGAIKYHMATRTFYFHYAG